MAQEFTFNISLSVLNHLGRNLYRSFITVLGEAISNSWDAEADNVWIYLDREDSILIIIDDGIGMDRDSFQNKFLKIGYSKRKEGHKVTPNKKRPFIGRKGIGKLALLSCAERITVVSKTENTDIIGGTIDNSGLDKAIQDDLTPQQYPLRNINVQNIKKLQAIYPKGPRGTLIYFRGINEGIKNTEAYLKRIIALYFRFSLIDENFKIFFNNELITINHLDSLADATQFVWKINESKDPYLEKLLPKKHIKHSKTIDSPIIISGFIASVIKPAKLKIITTKEQIGIDLFVNGRLREKDVLKHIPSARIAESYLYGQLHCDFLDDEKDRFTSSREGIVSDDEEFQRILEELKTIVSEVIDDWDKWRIELRQDGDSENPRISKKERKSRELFNTIVEDFVPPEDSPNHDKVESWIKKLGNDAQFNFGSYGECFVSENLLRNCIEDQKIELSPKARGEIKTFKDKEITNKNTGNLSIELRKNNSDLSYLSMDDLAYHVDKPQDPNKEPGILRDAKEYKPIRDALAHTALLTDLAKLRLTSTYENIKARLKQILNG